MAGHAGVQSLYSKPPNLVFAFHGCDASVANEVIVNGASLQPSTNNYDWLGSGVYFWEQNYGRAFSWAQEQVKWGKAKKPAVIGAVIDLGHCLNLTDSTYIDLLKNEYELLVSDCDLTGTPLPVNAGKSSDKLLRRLDCAVIEHLHARIDSGDATVEALPDSFDTVRGLFSEGKPIYEGAGFKEKTHVQICVRNPNCIKALFSPRAVDDSWMVP